MVGPNDTLKVSTDEQSVSSASSSESSPAVDSTHQSQISQIDTIKAILEEKDRQIAELVKDNKSNSEKIIRLEAELFKEEKKLFNIFDFDKSEHLLWIPALGIGAYGIRFYLNYKKKLKTKKKVEESQFGKAKESYFEWRDNIYLWIVFYVLFFILVDQATKKARLTIREWIKNPILDFLLILISSLILGGLSVWDGYITSTLKTPLQRIAMKAESANIAEKDRKELLSKTQTMNELFKETFKKFSLITIPPMFKVMFKGSKYLWILDAWLFFALGVGVWQILEMNKKINEIQELETVTKTNKEV